MVFSVFFWRAAIVFFKCFGIVAGIVKTGFIADFQNRHIGFRQQFGRLAQPVSGQIGDRRLGQVFTEQRQAAAFANIAGVGNLIEGQGFLIVFLYKGNHIFDSRKLPVWPGRLILAAGEILVQRDP